MTSKNNGEEPAEEFDSEWTSRTQKKLAVEALQDLGEALLDLSPKDLARIPVPDVLLDAIEEARRMPTRESKRRSRQFIGRLMRGIDLEPIQKAMQELHDSYATAIGVERTADRWRQRLLAAGDLALTEFLQAYPQAEKQRLRQVLMQAQKEQQAGRPPKMQRQLFRLLRDTMGASASAAADGPTDDEN